MCYLRHSVVTSLSDISCKALAQYSVNKFILQCQQNNIHIKIQNIMAVLIHKIVFNYKSVYRFLHPVI